jgi:hypothetical protein
VLLTFVADLGLSGLWWGLTVGLTMTTLISCVDLGRVNWEKEVGKAGERAKLGDEEADIALQIAAEDDDEESAMSTETTVAAAVATYSPTLAVDPMATPIK